MFASPPRPEKRLRVALAAGLCGAALILGACSGGDKAVVDEITVDAASLDLSGADSAALAQLFTVRPRGGSEAQTLAALDALGLADYADNRTIDGSNVTYTDWSAQQNDSVITASRVVLRGVHGTGEDARFDALEVSDMRAQDFEMDEDGKRIETVDATVGELVVVDPSADLALDLSQLLRGKSDGDRAGDVSEITEELEFSGLRVEDFQADVADDTNTGTLKVVQMVFGNDAESETADVVVEGIDFDWSSGQGPVRLQMDGMTALGVNMARGEANPLAGSPLGALSALAPTSALPYREVDLGKMSFVSDAFELQFDGFEADTSESGSVLTLRSVLSPALLTIKDGAGTPLAPHMDVLRENGLAEITLKGSTTTVVDRKADTIRVQDGRLEIDEGLRMACDYELGGAQAAAKMMKDSGVTQPTAEYFETQEDIDAFMTAMTAYEEAQKAASDRITINGLDCTVQDVPDNSLVTRGYTVASQVTGRPVAVLKGGAKTMIALSSMTASSEFQRDLMDVVGSGLIDFIDNPGQTMRVTIAPDAPVAIGTLTGDDPSLKPLGLTVEVE